VSAASSSAPVLVGRFGRPHGVRGEVRLQSFTQDPGAIAGYGPFASADGSRLFELESCRPQGDVFVAAVKGVHDRTAAETLTNIDLYVPRERLPAPQEDEFFQADLVGCHVVTEDGADYGTVTGIANYGAGDILDIRLVDGEAVMLPFRRIFVPEVDIAARRIVVVPPVETDGEREQPSS
jgi:16S rRNA processing protein RimM